MINACVVSDSLIRDMTTLHSYRGTVYVWIGLNHDIWYIYTLRWTVSTAVLALYYCTSTTWYPNGTAGGHASRFRRGTIHRSSHAHLKLSTGNLHSIWAAVLLSSSRAKADHADKANWGGYKFVKGDISSACTRYSYTYFTGRKTIKSCHKVDYVIKRAEAEVRRKRERRKMRS